MESKRQEMLVSVKNWEEIDRAADEICQVLKRAYGQPPVYRQVNCHKFRKDVDLRYYQRLQAVLVDQGYHWVGDVEWVNFDPQETKMRTFIRCMINPTHNTSIGIYHLRPKTFLGFLSQEKVFECETEFDTGLYLVTTNAAKTPLVGGPPNFDVLYLPPKTSYRLVLKAHFHRLQQAIAAGLSPTPLYTLNDVLDLEQRIHQAKSQYRQQIGYITLRELGRFLPETTQENPENLLAIEQRLKEKLAGDIHR